jgi:hypothetical protein
MKIIQNRKKFTLIFITVFLIIAPGLVFGQPKERVLVLGFDCRQLNDIQDRLLREAILKEFHDRGFVIVPVMEIESLFYGSRIRQIRRLKRDAIKGICDDLGAGYACYGTIVPENGARDGMIMPGKNYICAVTYYQKEGNRFYELKLMVPGKESLLEYFKAVAAEVVERFGKLR